jgi:hypothetical protein
VTQLKNQMPVDTHPAFVRALIFGLGGAVLGLIVYAAFGIITGLEIGYLSLAVGYIVGKAIRMGSGGLGGRRYQIAAVAFTYAAVSIAAVPIGLYEYFKDAKGKPRPAATSTAPRATSSASPEPEGQAVPASSVTTPRPTPNFAKLIIVLIGYGLASPFTALQDPVHGAIGIIILVVGIRIAWQLTGAPHVDILGPFRATAAPQPGS